MSQPCSKPSYHTYNKSQLLIMSHNPTGSGPLPPIPSATILIRTHSFLGTLASLWFLEYSVQACSYLRALHWKSPLPRPPLSLDLWLSLITLVLIKYQVLGLSGSPLSFLPLSLHSDGVFCQYLLICVLSSSLEEGKWGPMQVGSLPVIFTTASHIHGTW